MLLSEDEAYSGKLLTPYTESALFYRPLMPHTDAYAFAPVLYQRVHKNSMMRRVPTSRRWDPCRALAPYAHLPSGFP